MELIMKAPGGSADVPLRSGARAVSLWGFGVAIFAGAVAPFVTVAMPFFLRREGIPVVTIAEISATATLPFAFMITWSPLADMLLRRRSWVVGGNLVSASLLFVAIILPRPEYLTLFTVLLTGGNVAFSLAAIALGGMMAVSVPDRMRGKAAGWYQAGSLGSIPMLGGIVPSPGATRRHCGRPPTSRSDSTNDRCFSQSSLRPAPSIHVWRKRLTGGIPGSGRPIFRVR